MVALSLTGREQSINQRKSAWIELVVSRHGAVCYKQITGHRQLAVNLSLHILLNCPLNLVRFSARCGMKILNGRI
jgi:hypothetical protein